MFSLQLFPCLSFSVRLLANYTVSCLASCPLFFFPALTHFPSFFLKALLSPDRLAGDKTWSFDEERDIWEQDGERDGGHVPTWSPSAGSVETLTARRWVPFTACVQHPAVQHLWIRCQIKFMLQCWQEREAWTQVLFSSLVAECIFYEIFCCETFCELQ